MVPRTLKLLVITFSIPSILYGLDVITKIELWGGWITLSAPIYVYIVLLIGGEDESNRLLASTVSMLASMFCMMVFFGIVDGTMPTSTSLLLAGFTWLGGCLVGGFALISRERVGDWISGISLQPIILRCREVEWFRALSRPQQPSASE